MPAFCGHFILPEELRTKQRRPPIGARQRSGSGNAITEHWHGRFAQAPWPNSAFNADATMGHRFAILMAHGGALRASRSGAG